MRGIIIIGTALILLVCIFIAPIYDSKFQDDDDFRHSKIYENSQKFSTKALGNFDLYEFLLDFTSGTKKLENTQNTEIIKDEIEKILESNTTKISSSEILDKNESVDKELPIQILNDVNTTKAPILADFNATKPAQIPMKIDENLTVVLIGDSVMQGIYYWGFLDEFKGSKAKISNLSMKSTGLFSGIWGKKLKDELKDIKTQKIIIAHFGPNDWGSKNMKFSDEWVSKYRKKIKEIYEVAKSENAEVFWLQIPCMKSKNFSFKAEKLNEIFAKVADEENGHFIAINDIICGENGEFLKYKKFGKKNHALRADDGIHLSFFGASVISKKIIREYEKN